MKRIFALLLALCLLFSFVGCGKGEAVRDFGSNHAPTTEPTVQTQPTELETHPTELEILPTEPESGTITPSLYKVSDDNGHVIWLFGSIHVGYDYFYPLPEYVTQAYEASDALAVECDIVAFQKDLSAQMEALQGMVYLDGTRISDHIPEELYTEAVAALTDAGVYMSALDMYKPILWFSFIDSALYEKIGAQSDMGIDLHFLNGAYETGKKILEVESAKFQYEMLAGFSEELQLLLLEEIVPAYQNPLGTLLQTQSMVNLWASGDAEGLAAMLQTEEAFESEEERLLYEEYSNALIVQRNISMADWAEEALASGDTVFIVVGAAHVVGPGAMADLLAQRGYTVETVGP